MKEGLFIRPENPLLEELFKDLNVINSSLFALRSLNILVNLKVKAYKMIKKKKKELKLNIGIT